MTRIVRKSGQSYSYALKTPLEIFQTEWKLTDHEKECLSSFSLRNWNIQELLDMLQWGPDGIHLTVRLWNMIYSATMQVDAKTYSTLSYLVSRQKDWPVTEGVPLPKFWLSFRAGNWNGTEFAFVIVQEDKGGERK